MNKINRKYAKEIVAEINRDLDSADKYARDVCQHHEPITLPIVFIRERLAVLLTMVDEDARYE